MPGFLSLLSLKRFRNLERLELAPHPQFNFFYGDNAQGKTSILEGIYFLSELRSFRSQELQSLLHHGEEEGLLEAQVAEEGLFHDIRVRLKAQGKTVHLNGKSVRPFRRLRKILPLVLFVPDSVRLFRSSPS